MLLSTMSIIFIEKNDFDILASDANKFRLLIKKSLLNKLDQLQLKKSSSHFR